MSRACFETTGDGLAYVIQGLGLRASLGYAARNGRALSNEHSGFIGLQSHEQLHTSILLHLASDDGDPDISERTGRRLAALDTRGIRRSDRPPSVPRAL